MGTGNDPVGGTDAEATDPIERYVDALTDASTRRHRLARGTAEYEAALEQEERLVARIWRLGSAGVRAAVTVKGGSPSGTARGS